MKKVKMVTIPQCDICKAKPAKYDQPYKGPQWAYTCKDCGNSKCSLGSELVQYVQPPQTGKGKEVKGIHRSDFESTIEVECEDCNEVRTMEPDSTEFNCECGAIVTYESMI